MKIGNVDIQQVRGFADKAFGLQKEWVGTVLGREQLANEGQAQQEKGSAQLKALRAEVKADAARVEAAAREKQQKAAARAK
jgi:uncharacterized protein YjbJ (UPF0337 family)